MLTSFGKALGTHKFLRKILLKNNFVIKVLWNLDIIDKNKLSDIKYSKYKKVKLIKI